MRLSYSPAEHLLLFLVQWTDCHLAGSLGLLRVLIYKAHVDGKTAVSIQERKASIKGFYGVIFPTLLQLYRGVSDVEERKQKDLWATKYKKSDEHDRSTLRFRHRRRVCICIEIDSKIVLPHCSHLMCMKCYRSWRAISQSCPFCRDSLKWVNSDDLWIYTSRFEIVNPCSTGRENIKRLVLFVKKLPAVIPEAVHVS